MRADSADAWTPNIADSGLVPCQQRVFPDFVTQDFVSPNSDIHVSVSDLYIPKIGLFRYRKIVGQIGHGHLTVERGLRPRNSFSGNT
jgi:hypothetical protein